MDSTEKPQAVIAYKGFDLNLRCRDFQYKVGETYTHAGKVERCSGGFHACEHPLDVFGYYNPASSRFALVELSGDLSREQNGDTKIAAGRITIKGELKLPDVIAAAVKYVFDRAKSTKNGTNDEESGAASATGYSGAASATGHSGAASATGHSGAASATGYRGAASATGDRGAASATGYSGAASATGYSGAASATGDRGAASATGDRGAASATGHSGAASATGYIGAASATGEKSAAMASGRHGRAMGAAGCAIFLVYRDDDLNITHAKAAIAGKDVKADTWYSLNEAGKFVEVA